MKSQRIVGFDLLRGLCALGVAFYHMVSWIGLGQLKPISVGLYGVLAFFVLSGASMYVSYSDRFAAGYSIPKFIAQRFFRLAPLYALVVFFGPWHEFQSWQSYGLDFYLKTILNVTFAFGLALPGKISGAIGGWSLGVEFTFYLLFPVILAFTRQNWKANLAFLIFVMAVQVIFMESQVKTGSGFSEIGWYSYATFLGSAAYFVSGCLLGKLIQNQTSVETKAWQRLAVWMAFIMLAIIIVVCAGDTDIATLTGKRGIALMLGTVAIVAVSSQLAFNRVGAYFARKLGDMSYGVYLLHPFAYREIRIHCVETGDMMGSPLTQVMIALALTSVMALIVEKLFERPIMDMGKKWLAGKVSAPAGGGSVPPAPVI